jgi:uncharacterized membrane protein YdjX (TVP38/TMEM64 family)
MLSLERPWLSTGARTAAARLNAGWTGILMAALAIALAALLLPGVREAAAWLLAAPGRMDAGGVRDALHALGIWAPVVYVLIQVAQVLVPFLPAAPITFAGVLLFGWQAGLTLSMAGSVLGGAIQFAAVRRWGRPLVARLVGEEMLARYAGLIDPRGWWLLAAFLVPFAPADAFSALAGLSAISFRRFMLVSTLGRLPWAAGTVLLAAGVVDGSTMTWATAGLSVVMALVVGLACRRRIEARLSRSGSQA